MTANKSVEIFKLKFGFQTSCVVRCTALSPQHRFVCRSNFLDKAMYCLFLLIFIYLFSLIGVLVERTFVCSKMESRYSTVREVGGSLWEGGVTREERPVYSSGHQSSSWKMCSATDFLYEYEKNPLLIKCLWALQQDLGLVPKKFGNLGLSLSLPKFPIWKACFVQRELSSWLTVSVSQWKIRLCTEAMLCFKESPNVAGLRSFL